MLSYSTICVSSFTEKALKIPVLITKEIIIKLVNPSQLTDATDVSAAGWRGVRVGAAPSKSGFRPRMCLCRNCLDKSCHKKFKGL